MLTRIETRLISLLLALAQVPGTALATNGARGAARTAVQLNGTVQSTLSGSLADCDGAVSGNCPQVLVDKLLDDRGGGGSLFGWWTESPNAKCAKDLEWARAKSPAELEATLAADPQTSLGLPANRVSGGGCLGRLGSLQPQEQSALVAEYYSRAKQLEADELRNIRDEAMFRSMQSRPLVDPASCGDPALPKTKELCKFYAEKCENRPAGNSSELAQETVEALSDLDEYQGAIDWLKKVPKSQQTDVQIQALEHMIQSIRNSYAWIQGKQFQAKMTGKAHPARFEDVLPAMNDQAAMDLEAAEGRRAKDREAAHCLNSPSNDGCGEFDKTFEKLPPYEYAALSSGQGDADAVVRSNATLVHLLGPQCRMLTRYVNHEKNVMIWPIVIGAALSGVGLIANLGVKALQTTSVATQGAKAAATILGRVAVGAELTNAGYGIVSLGEGAIAVAKNCQEAFNELQGLDANPTAPSCPADSKDGRPTGPSVTRNWRRCVREAALTVALALVPGLLHKGGKAWAAKLEAKKGAVPAPLSQAQAPAEAQAPVTSSGPKEVSAPVAENPSQMPQNPAAAEPPVAAAQATRPQVPPEELSPQPLHKTATGMPWGRPARLVEGEVAWYHDPKTGKTVQVRVEKKILDNAVVSYYDEATGMIKSEMVTPTTLTALSPGDKISWSNQRAAEWMEKTQAIEKKINEGSQLPGEKARFLQSVVRDATESKNLPVYDNVKELQIQGENGLSSEVHRVEIVEPGKHGAEGKFFRSMNSSGGQTARNAMAYSEMANAFGNSHIAPPTQLARVRIQGQSEPQVGALSEPAKGQQGQVFSSKNPPRPTADQIDEARAFGLVVSDSDLQHHNLFYDSQVGFQFIDPGLGLQPVAARPSFDALGRRVFGIGVLPPDHFSPRLLQQLQSLRQAIPAMRYLSEEEKASRILHIDALLELAGNREGQHLGARPNPIAATTPSERHAVAAAEEVGPSEASAPAAQALAAQEPTQKAASSEAELGQAKAFGQRGGAAVVESVPHVEPQKKLEHFRRKFDEVTSQFKSNPELGIVELFKDKQAIPEGGSVHVRGPGGNFYEWAVPLLARKDIQIRVSEPNFKTYVQDVVSHHGGLEEYFGKIYRRILADKPELLKLDGNAMSEKDFVADVLKRVTFWQESRKVPPSNFLLSRLPHNEHPGSAMSTFEPLSLAHDLVGGVEPGGMGWVIPDHRLTPDHLRAAGITATNNLGNRPIEYFLPDPFGSDTSNILNPSAVTTRSGGFGGMGVDGQPFLFVRPTER